MMRGLMGALLLCLGLSTGAWAMDDGAVLSEATKRKIQAEEQLAQARAAIIDERTRLAAGIEEQQRQIESLRVTATEAIRARDEAQADVKRRHQDHERELLRIRQLVERALVAARLDPSAVKALASASPVDRVEAAATALIARAKDLPAHLSERLQVETVVGRSGEVASVPVLRLGDARAVALGSTSDTRGALARVGNASQWVVSGAMLPSAIGLGSELARIPLDPDNSLSKQASAHERTFSDWLRAGRFFIWPILLVLAMGIAIAIERTIGIARSGVDRSRLAEVVRLVEAGSFAEAGRLVAARQTPLDRVLADGIAVRDRSRAAREAALERRMLDEAPRIQRGLSLLMVLAGIAPLLGLLGTVTGMIDMFSVIASHGSGNAKSLSGSISEALVTTQAGMIVAIPLLVTHAILARLVERRLMALEEAGCGLLGIDSPPSPAASTSSTAPLPEPLAGGT